MKPTIILDTETTGIDSDARVISLGVIEMVENRRSARQNEWFFNPGRPCEPGAYAVHGVSDAFLRTQPSFARQAAEIVDWIGDALIIAHNAPFDRRMLNGEFARLRHKPSSIDYREISYPDDRWWCSLQYARRKFKGQKQACGLDALCDLYKIDRGGRRFHGALKDCHLLAQVWERMRESEQGLLDLGEVPSLNSISPAALALLPEAGSVKPAPYRSKITETEIARHRGFHKGVLRAKSKKGTIWDEYRKPYRDHTGDHASAIEGGEYRDRDPSTDRG